MNPILVAILLGLLQGILEWIPVSSEGGVALASTVATGVSPAAATRLALFLHAGTAVAATAYYRTEVRTILRSIRELSRRPFADETADLSFIVIATAATAVTGLPAYLVLDAAVSNLEGGLFLALVGGLLVVTGLLQRFAAALSLGEREIPDGVDAVLVGVLQGLAILPGVSRSGTTVSACCSEATKASRRFGSRFCCRFRPRSPRTYWSSLTTACRQSTRCRPLSPSL